MLRAARIWQSVAALLCTVFGALNAAAVDFAFSGFGTAGYAISDTDAKYLRFIDDQGTFKTDSLLGLQVETRFNAAWGATIQGVASAPRGADSGYEATLRWAFVSYRPNNDWLLRAGRLRPPVLINTQNAEVGVTYDQARLPVEVYSLSPVYDFDGAALTRTWVLDHSEISLDAYWGKRDIRFRLPFQRAASPGQVLMGAGGFAAFPQDRYIPETVTVKGLILSYTREPWFVRGGVHHAVAKPEFPPGETLAPTTVPAPSPFGGTLLLPVNPQPRFDITVLTLGAEWRSDDWRVTGEYGQRIVNDTKFAFGSRAGYVTVARRIGQWTPYATHARISPASGPRKLYEEANATPVPLAVQGPPFFISPDFHRALADLISVYDQHSTMLGASYSFSAKSKLKIEWMRTHVGLASAFVDGDVHNKSFNVFSLSYSFAF